tara:strand:- start:1212 stop:1379 length:168 start_codon:yes stop_codon:yes gene_type:complete
MGSKELQRMKWTRIENGKEPDDYQNPFLSHFGFMDYPLTPYQERTRKKIKRYYGY